MRTSKTVSATGAEYVSFVSCWMRRSIATPCLARSGEEVRLVDLVADAVAGVLDAGQERAEPLAEDLPDVDVAQLAVEAAEQPLRRRPEPGAAGDRAERVE